MAEAAGLADADDDEDPVCDDDDPVVSEYFRTIKRGRVDEVESLLLDEGNNISVNHVSDDTGVLRKVKRGQDRTRHQNLVLPT